jgi:hypothetical protein
VVTSVTIVNAESVLTWVSSSGEVQVAVPCDTMDGVPGVEVAGWKSQGS